MKLLVGAYGCPYAAKLFVPAFDDGYPPTDADAAVAADAPGTLSPGIFDEFPCDDAFKAN